MGRADEDFGPVELTLGERIVLIDNDADGESLRVTEAEWLDPFSEPLSVENQDFVKRSGKWSSFDVSTSDQWARLIGDRLSEVEPVANAAGKLTGVILRTDHECVLRLGVMADELFVDELTTSG